MTTNRPKSADAARVMGSGMGNVRVISYGGGVQSTAMLVLAARGEIDYKTALFCNVGDDSENPATLVYVREHVMPWAEAQGLDVRELHRVRRNGERETLMERIDRSERSVPIPMRMTNGAPGNRQCTGDFKIKVIAKEIKAMGATKDNPATVALGISLDEYQRMRTSQIAYQVNDYPLIELRLDRNDCHNIIESAGLPVAPKSSCFFCPFKSKAQWKDLLINQPDLFEKSAALERKMIERRKKMGKDPIWMTASAKPLDEAITDDGQLDLWGGSCDIGGYCHS